MPLDIEDHAELARWLVGHGHAPNVETVRCRTLNGGVSNRTVWVEVGGEQAPEGHGPGPRGVTRWVLKQALAKLRVKDEWLSDVDRIRREAEALRVLPELAPAGTVTPLVFEAPGENLLAMEAVPLPHLNLKTLLLEATLSRDQAAELAGQLGRLLGQVQAKAAAHAGELRSRFANRSFFESLRIAPYYETSAEREPVSQSFYATLIGETRRTAERDATLVHGDFSPKNVLVREGRVVLLDHEVIHWGDGTFDVGFCLTHLLSKAHHVRVRREDYREAAICFWEAYAARRRADAGRCVRHSLGCLLARVVGKSPLEYLTSDEQRRQRSVVLGLMQSPPATVEALVRAFVEGIES